ncbi:acyl-CoA dehydrogenase family protein [Nonomuraea sp. NPDC049714]|uniref:acyl-CoA dehydrogenase family protein n=1 Tax=Nonomuraea sp. NPDC049714 TaxID=3364357 RepID=UPI0037921C1C
MPGSYTSAWKTESVRAVYDLASAFVSSELLPNREKWEAQHHVDRDVWLRAADLGLLCCSIPEQYGGGGGTIAHDLAVCEAQARAGETSWGNMVHSGIVAHYLLAYGTEDQKRRWLPRLAAGEMIGAIAMTEPGTGSDLQGIRTRAVRDGEAYVIDGAKTFISNGHLADLVLVVARTDPARGVKGISLIVVETADCPGFVRGRILEKVGQHGADTAEFSFERTRVPADHLLGGVEGQGFAQLMNQLPQERLLISVLAVAGMEAAMEQTVDYVKQRQAFGQTIWDFQNTKFTLAEGATATRIARVFLDSCVDLHLEGRLDTATAAMAKWWLTEQQVTLIDECVQLHGGYGYMREYPIARMYQDARVQKIYGGANEVMKDLVARSL